MFCAFWTGLSGCWKRSAASITATAILMLMTCLLAAGAMGLWHTVEFFEKEKVVGEEFYQQWNSVNYNILISTMCARRHISMDIFFLLSFHRFYVIIPEYHTIGHILLPGLEFYLRSSLPFYYLVLLSVYETNAKKRTN